MSSLPDIPPYRLSRVHIEHFEENDAGPRHEIGVRPVGYSYRIGAALDEKRSEVTVTPFLGVDLAPAGVDPDDLGPDLDAKRIASLTVSCTFHLADLDGLRGPEGHILVPGPLMAVWVGVAFSTARGILIGRSRHPLFGEAPFPVLSPKEIVAQLVASDSPDWVDSQGLPPLPPEE